MTNSNSIPWQQLALRDIQPVRAAVDNILSVLEDELT